MRALVHDPAAPAGLRLAGPGPPVGTRVPTFAFGNGWAQRRVARTADTAVVPDGWTPVWPRPCPGRVSPRCGRPVASAGCSAGGCWSRGLGWRAPWTQASEVAQALIDRTVEGKAVLDVG